MRTIALIEKDENGFGIFTPDLESTIIGEGKSVEEAKADFMNSYKEVIDSYIENGEAVPEELIDLEFAFKYDVASVFNEFPFINAMKLAEYLGISPGLMRHYKAGDTYISEAQAKRIEAGLHEFAERLLQVAL